MRSLLLMLLLGWFPWARAEEPIRIELNSSIALNPLIVVDEAQVQILDLIFDRLITMDAQGNFMPQLLESWTFSPDRRELILKVRPGLRWQNDAPLDADDILFTWKLMRSPQMLKLGDNQSAGIPHMEKLDALTLRIKLERPRATLLAELYNFQPVPRSYPPVTNPDKHPYVKFPVGSGPYRVSPESGKNKLILVRWNGYRGPHPGQWPRIEYNLAGGSAATRRLENGEIHFFESSSWFTYYMLRSGIRGFKNVMSVQGTREGWRGIWCNCDPKFSVLSDVRLRRALAELYPWDAIGKLRSVWPVQAAGCVWAPSSWAYDGTQHPLPRRQLAESYLDDAGWKRGPDGWRRNAAGQELRLEYVAQKTANPDPIITSFLAGARECGIRIEERGVTYAQLTDAQAKGQGDLWLTNWVNNGPDPNGDSNLFTTEGIRSNTNVSRYRNPLIDQLFDDGVHATDPEQRSLIYRRINQILTADRPLILLDYAVYYGFYHRRLKGVVYNTRGNPYGFVPGMRGWRLDQ
jgi:peptide/nickel transport system substrate-binding protein